MVFHSDMYSVFALDILIILFSKASLYRSSSNSSTSLSLAHNTTSSANCPGALSDVCRPWIHHDGKQERCWKRILGGVQLPRQLKGSLVPAVHLTTFSHLRYMSFTTLMYFSGTPLSRMHQYSSSLETPDPWIHSVSLAVLCIFLAAVLAQK